MSSLDNAPATGFLHMSRLAAGILAACVGASTLAHAQGANFPPNEMGVTMGHWHLNSRNPEAAKKILVGMGGVAIKDGDFEVVTFPGVAVYLNMEPGTPPPTGGMMGSTINHVGLNVPNVAEAVARWKAAGVNVLPGNNGRTDQAYVDVTDGVQVEILEEIKDTKFPIQHHHLHYSVPSAPDARSEIQAWYVKVFGAKAVMRGTNVAAEIPGANLTFGNRFGEWATTKGRALDHIGFDVTSLEAFCKRLEAAGIKLEKPYTKDPRTDAGRAFLFDPWGTYIELNERRKPL
jgi:catechol 2,3-dioxygenase-like lactoylglutathione lyase family enzyme